MLQITTMGKSNIVEIVSNQSSNERLEKDSGEKLKAGREKLVDISFNQDKILSKSCMSKKEKVDKTLTKKEDEGNEENLPDYDDGAIVISSDEEEKVEEENDEKEVRFEDLKRRAYQFLDQFFEQNPSMLAELKAKLEVQLLKL